MAAATTSRNKNKLVGRGRSLAVAPGARLLASQPGIGTALNTATVPWPPRLPATVVSCRSARAVGAYKMPPSSPLLTYNFPISFRTLESKIFSRVNFRVRPYQSTAYFDFRQEDAVVGRSFPRISPNMLRTRPFLPPPTSSPSSSGRTGRKEGRGNGPTARSLVRLRSPAVPLALVRRPALPPSPAAYSLNPFLPRVFKFSPRRVARWEAGEKEEEEEEVDWWRDWIGEH